MQTIAHMNKTVTLFPFDEMTHFKIISGAGEGIMDRFYSALRKRKRAEYFKRVQRRAQRAKKESDIVV